MSLLKNDNNGFTLIEMIVSLAIFSIIVTITIGSLLVLIANNQKLQGEQSVMTNLAFALDSMTREIRTGTNYYCDSTNTADGNSIAGVGVDLDELLGDSTNSCPDGKTNNSHSFQGISFKEEGDSITGASVDRIAYFFDKSDSDNKVIKRKVGAGAAQSIISSGLEIVDAEFFVSGAAPLSDGDVYQPTVTIHITAKEIDNDKLYYLQTTVTQRTLDL